MKHRKIRKQFGIIIKCITRGEESGTVGTLRPAETGQDNPQNGNQPDYGQNGKQHMCSRHDHFFLKRILTEFNHLNASSFLLEALNLKVISDTTANVTKVMIPITAPTL